MRLLSVVSLFLMFVTVPVAHGDESKPRGGVRLCAERSFERSLARVQPFSSVMATVLRLYLSCWKAWGFQRQGKVC